MINRTRFQALAPALVIVAVSLAPSIAPADSTTESPGPVETRALAAEVDQFLTREMTAHFAAITSLKPPPNRVQGALTTGEFSWGTFMRALAAYAEMTGRTTIADRNIAAWVGKIGLIEARGGGKAFSQLYAALSLRAFGMDLNTNPVWLSLSDSERAEWRSLLDPARFYDFKTRHVINLPENYLGVASRIAAISYKLGIRADRAFVDSLLDRAAEQFVRGARYSDDAPPTGRYDRYSNEYARYIWEAAETAGRRDILEALRPSLAAQMRLWWDVVSPDGYGYNWGRSLGVVSYLDTLEIAAFLGEHAEFRSAPLADLASLYNRAWTWLRRDYRDNAHLLSIFAFGRGNYAYITPEREWQQTVGFFGKLADAHKSLMQTLARERISIIPAVPALGKVARFELFRRGAGRQAGVWLVREGPLRFALPITTGPKPGVADYLPSPHGLPGFAAPVEQVYPALAPFLELADGRVIVACDGADEIEPAPDGESLHAVWRRWALVGATAGETIDPGITADVVWRIAGTTLTREETLTAAQPVAVRRWWVSVPTTARRSFACATGGCRARRFESGEGTLEVTVNSSDWPITDSVLASGDDAIGRGARGPIPLHLVFESRDLKLERERPAHWQISIRVASGRGNS